jgi:tRNA-intron endonuclease
VQNKVLVQDRRTIDQLSQKGFGERKDRELVLDLKEAVFLIEKEKLDVEDEKEKKISREELLKLGIKSEKNFYSKFLVYADLRQRGYVVRTGYKFGFDLRVYPRGKKPGEEHTQWVIDVKTQDDKFTMPAFSRAVRLSGNLKTTLLVAVVDSENDINYYEVKRLVP